MDGSFLGIIETNPREPVRSILYQNGYLILGIPKEPIIRIYKDKKLYLSFGELPEYYKFYPSGTMINLAASSETIFCALPLSYPILGFSYDGKKKIEIGNPDLMIKPYKILEKEEKKDFKKIGKIVQIILFEEKIISVQLLPDSENCKNAWDIFNLHGNLIKTGFYIDNFLLTNEGKHLILQDNEKRNRLIIAKIKEEK